jgi:hypothetical protein
LNNQIQVPKQKWHHLLGVAFTFAQHPSLSIFIFIFIFKKATFLLFLAKKKKRKKKKKNSRLHPS